MYLSRSASRARLREAQNARNNRAEIVKALSTGDVTRRELVKHGQVLLDLGLGAAPVTARVCVYSPLCHEPVGACLRLSARVRAYVCARVCMRASVWRRVVTLTS